MILTKIRIQEEHPMISAYTEASWPLPVIDLHVDPSAGVNGYILRNTVGLDPPDFAQIVEGFDVYGVPIKDTVLTDREIVFRIALSPGVGQPYSVLRDAWYKFVNRSILISFMNGYDIVAQAKGFIRNFEAVHFSNQPEVIVTILCDNGELTAPEPLNIPLATLDTLHPVINYEIGTAPTGIELKFEHTGASPIPYFTIYNHNRLWYQGTESITNFFEVDYELEPGDIVTITTDLGNRRIKLERDFDILDLAGYINPGAVWPKLYPGVTTWDWTFDTSSWMTWISAGYYPKYWGV